MATQENATSSAPQQLPSTTQALARDTMAGIITGFMAVPLSAGICLMSDYPVMTGLYTVVLAGIVSYIMSIIRPGNHTGMPGIAAGLAPALALGVATFGMENMPFVIVLTAVFQAVVWYKEWERFLLKIVPPYLIEGLLAGVGLKIMLKFIPYLKTSHMVEEVLVIGSLILFFMMYSLFKKKMPALPYILIMILGVGSTYLYNFDKLSLQEVPFQLSLPLPHLAGDLDTQMWILAKMIGFALILGSIDVIEQVMSHVAIVKLDEFKRPHNVNNGLFAIWVANLLATAFGGMTNLDGLAKSTTNTVAGAVTKRSNLVTSLFIFMVVLAPWVIEVLPMYTLSIIMIYSGYNMISKLKHVWSEGIYPMTLSVACAGLVYAVGIFEGLVVILGVHASIQGVFMIKNGLGVKEIMGNFKEKMK